MPLHLTSEDIKKRIAARTSRKGKAPGTEKPNTRKVGSWIEYKTLSGVEEGTDRVVDEKYSGTETAYRDQGQQDIGTDVDMMALAGDPSDSEQSSEE